MIYTYKKQEFYLEMTRSGFWNCFIQGYCNVKADTLAGLKFMVRRVVDFLKPEKSC